MIRPLTILSISLVLCSCNSKEKNEENDNKDDKQVKTTTQIAPPDAEQVPYEMEVHGDKRVDPYYWMRLTDEQKEAKDPDEQTQKVVDYLNAENAYTKSVLKPTEKLQKTLFDEIVGRIKKDDSSAPYPDNGYFYYVRYEKDNEYEIICRKKTLDAEEEVLLDVNKLAVGHDYYSVGDYEVSPDNKLFAYSYDDVSRRQYKIKVINIATGETVGEGINNTDGEIVWGNDNRSIFYVVKDPVTLREYQIYRHDIVDGGKDELVYTEKDETYSCEVEKSKSGKYLYIHSYSTMSSEYRTLEADNPTGEFKLFHKREGDLIYDIRHYDEGFYVLTNADAKNFKLMKCPENATDRSNWKEVIPHRENTRLEDVEIFKTHVVLQERINGLTKLRVLDHHLSGDHYIEFDEETYSVHIGNNMIYDTSVLRYNYSSLKVPQTVYDYDMQKRTTELIKREEVVGGHNPDDYETERVWATADDGKKVAISMVYKKGLKKDGNNPVLLYGYGSYGYTISDGFNSSRLSLIDRGFIYAIAHIRGSEYMGRHWYEDGKKFTKMNTFTDFIAAGEHLIAENYTNPDKLFAMGGSAGGLLMGAVINMKPEIFKGAVAAVPFVDVVTTMLDESIPLTTSEFDEWGNPKEKDYYDYMLSYSPYDNIEAKDYPNLLITTGYWDSQVQYWEPAKWIAKLRDMKTDDNLLLMDCNMSTGHGGASGRYEAYKEVALEYAFMLYVLGNME